jgi:hypothetical protein
MRIRTALPSLLGLLALGACAVPPPSAPTVLATPPEGKDLARFQHEDFTCRQHASGQIGYGNPSQAATNAAVGSAAVGTAVGAAAGALLGAAAGNAGAGAAVGAGAGLLTGSAVGGNQAAATGYGLQHQYDMAYAQCMTASGNTLQSQMVAGAPAYAYPAYPYGYYAPGYAAYPYWGPSVVIGGGWGWRGGWHHRGGWRGHGRRW